MTSQGNFALEARETDMIKITHRPDSRSTAPKNKGEAKRLFNKAVSHFSYVGGNNDGVVVDEYDIMDEEIEIVDAAGKTLVSFVY